MGAFTKDIGEPDGEEGAGTGPLPEAVPPDLRIDEGAHAEILQQPQEKRDRIDLFVHESRGCSIKLHSPILPNSPLEFRLPFTRMSSGCQAGWLLTPRRS